MKSIAIASALAYAGSVSAFWRMPCRSVTGYGRLDPLVNPGSISDHVHAITGGGGKIERAALTCQVRMLMNYNSIQQQH